jgi:hypothetical protein
MAQTAAHLVDHVIPQVPVRQWVLSLPIPLRLLLAAQPKLVSRQRRRFGHRTLRPQRVPTASPSGRAPGTRS